MIHKTWFKYLLFVIMVIFFSISVSNSIKIIKSFTGSIQQSSEENSYVKLKEFQRIDSVLESTIETDTFQFKGSLKSPFRKLHGTTVKKRKIKTQEPIKELFLKGILIKNNALAIIEDEDGKTHICKKGDKVHNRLIAKIGENEVVIIDRNGKTILKVKK